MPSAIISGISSTFIILSSKVMAAIETPNGAGGNAVSQILGTIGDWMQYIGGIVAVFGLGSLIFSIHNDQPDGKTRALKVMAMGAVAMGFKSLASLFVSMK